jgi:cobalamin biosynthesis protein CobT
MFKDNIDGEALTWAHRRPGSDGASHPDALPREAGAIGIGHDVGPFYAHATRTSKIDHLDPALMTKLLSLLSD